MIEIDRPIHSPIIEGVPVRFFRPRGDVPEPPWTSVGDVLSVCGLSDQSVDAAMCRYRGRFPGTFRLVLAKGGKLTLAGLHQTVDLVLALQHADFLQDSVGQKICFEMAIAGQKYVESLFYREDQLAELDAFVLALGANIKDAAARYRPVAPQFGFATILGERFSA